MNTPNAIDCMDKALATFRERNKQYGSSYTEHGKVMEALMPGGFHPKTVEDHNRFCVLNQIVVKLLQIENY